MKRFVIGDIHGAHKAMLQCLERSGFDYANDLLISLGDLSDGWPDTCGVLDELLKIQNLIMIMGNHDIWLSRWFESGENPAIWLSQGGKSTIGSYQTTVPPSHKLLIKKMQPYYLLDDMLFVHGGFNLHQPIESQKVDLLAWDRSLISSALIKRHLDQRCKLTCYKRVFVGHTPTIQFGEDLPLFACDICMMDTGAGWPGGKLTIMDIDTLKYCSSDNIQGLYPGFTGRHGSIMKFFF